MPKTKEIGVMDTEEKIKNAARVVFQKKGYAAARTRDIAEEAGINIALLNYYFRSKEKLFEIVMLQTVFDFVQTLFPFVNDENTSFEQKIEILAASYIDKMQKEPYIPMFVLNEIQNRPESFLQKMQIKNLLLNAVIFRQFQEEVEKGRILETNLINFMMNIMGLIIMPFVAMPIIKSVGEIDNPQFAELLEERKKKIPNWIKKMMFV